MQRGPIQANGGVIEGGWFVFDPDVLATLRAAHGPGVPARVHVKPYRWCNPTPPFAPTLGGHHEPGIGYCEPGGLRPEWDTTWRDAPWRQAPCNPPPAPRRGFGAFPEKVDIVLTLGLFVVLGAVIWAYQKPEGGHVAR